MWSNITEKTDIDIKVVNALKTLKEIVSITQSLEKNHETVLQILENVEDARNGMVDLINAEEEDRTSTTMVNVNAISNATNDKINNRNDNISRVKMAIEDGSIKDKETPVDGDADAELLDDEDISSDEEDMDDPTMIDTTTVRDGINKYWLCNGECDDSKATNAGDINWDDNSKKRKVYEELCKEIEKIAEELNELKVYFTTKDKDILEVQQAADSIKKQLYLTRNKYQQLN